MDGTTSAREETNIAWSPDGDYLAVLYDTGCTEVHVIPSDGERVYLDNPKVNSSSVELQAYDLEDGQLSRICAFSEMDVSWGQ